MAEHVEEVGVVLQNPRARPQYLKGEILYGKIWCLCVQNTKVKSTIMIMVWYLFWVIFQNYNCKKNNYILI